MESKLTKMLKLAPNVADSLEKINYITSIPEVTVAAPIAATVAAPVAPVQVAGPVAVAAAPGAAPKTASLSAVAKKKIDK